MNTAVVLVFLLAGTCLGLEHSFALQSKVPGWFSSMVKVKYLQYDITASDNIWVFVALEKDFHDNNHEVTENLATRGGYGSGNVMHPVLERTVVTTDERLVVILYNGNDYAVSVKGNIAFEYETLTCPPNDDEQISNALTAWIMVACFCIVLLLTVIAVTLCVCRRPRKFAKPPGQFSMVPVSMPLSGSDSD